LIELNYKSLGPIDRKGEKKPPILILHGLFGMLDNWKSFGKKLAEEYEVYLIDQRDHGRSPHTDSFSYPLLAKDLKNFIEFHQLKKVHLIGHSMGGKTIMEAALRYPELIEKMVVVDMGVKNYAGGHESIIEALEALPIDKIQSRTEANEFLQERIANESVRLFLMKNLSRASEGTYKWKINLPLLASSYVELMDHNLLQREPSDVEVLFVKGAKSGYILEGDIEGIKSVFPKALVETIENAGHWVHAEQPEKLLSMVSTYFR